MTLLNDNAVWKKAPATPSLSITMHIQRSAGQRVGQVKELGRSNGLSIQIVWHVQRSARANGLASQTICQVNRWGRSTNLVRVACQKCCSKYFIKGHKQVKKYGRSNCLEGQTIWPVKLYGRSNGPISQMVLQVKPSGKSNDLAG